MAKKSLFPDEELSEVDFAKFLSKVLKIDPSKIPQFTNFYSQFFRFKPIHSAVWELDQSATQVVTTMDSCFKECMNAIIDLENQISKELERVYMKFIPDKQRGMKKEEL